MVATLSGAPHPGPAFVEQLGLGGQLTQITSGTDMQTMFYILWCLK